MKLFLEKLEGHRERAERPSVGERSGVTLSDGSDFWRKKQLDLHDLEPAAKQR